MKKIIALCFIFISILSSNAQNIKFLNAQEQHWVGGICCSYGVNYNFYFESSDTLKFIHIDTVWIGEKFFTEDQNSLTNFKNVRKGKTTYHITVSTRWNSNTSKGEEIIQQKPAFKTPHYKGKACMIYYMGKQRRIIPVPDFMKLSTIAYP
jgi:hypothetical protein